MIMLTFLSAWILLEMAVIAGQHYGWVWWAAMHLLFFIVFAGLEVGFLQI